MQQPTTGSPVIWLVAAALALGCAGQEGGDADAAQDQAAMGAAAEAAPDTMALAPKNDSGLMGSVVVAEAGDSTTVTVTLRGGTPGNSYPAHIHRGMCAEPGAVVQPLTSIAVGADSTGSSMTQVPTAVLEEAEASGPLLVQVHQPGGTPAACASMGS